MDVIREALRPFIVADGDELHADPMSPPDVQLLATTVLEHVLGGDAPDLRPPPIIGGLQVEAAIPATRVYGEAQRRWHVMVLAVFDPVNMHRYTVGTAQFVRSPQSRSPLDGEWRWDDDVTSVSDLRHDEALAWLARRVLAALPAGPQEAEEQGMGPARAVAVLGDAIPQRTPRVEQAFRVLYQVIRVARHQQGQPEASGNGSGS